MPALPKRPCAYPGCDELVEHGRCPAHEVLKPSSRKTTERGYGGVHRRLRIQCFLRDRWCCVDCGWEPRCVRVLREAELSPPPTEVILEELRVAYARNERHLHADHEIPIEVRPDLAAELSNYRTRCSICHNRKTAGEDGGFGNLGSSGSSAPKRQALAASKPWRYRGIG